MLKFRNQNHDKGLHCLANHRDNNHHVDPNRNGPNVVNNRWILNLMVLFIMSIQTAAVITLVIPIISEDSRSDACSEKAYYHHSLYTIGAITIIILNLYHGHGHHHRPYRRHQQQKQRQQHRDGHSNPASSSTPVVVIIVEIRSEQFKEKPFKPRELGFANDSRQTSSGRSELGRPSPALVDSRGAEQPANHEEGALQSEEKQLVQQWHA